MTLPRSWYQKDVVPSTYLDIHNQVFEAWNANPIANYIVEMGVNFVLGDGIQVRARNRKVQKVLDAFWHDPDNHMDLRLYDLCQELSLYGEIFVRFFVNDFNGDVKIVTIDPSMIDQIESDSENIEHEIRVHRRPIGPSATIPGQPAMPASLEQSDFDGVWLDVPDQVMHFAVNKVSNAKRVKSDLATLLPWLRRYKDWLIDRVRINKYKSAFLWDISLMNADRKTIEAKMQEHSRPPEPGSVIVHSADEIWTAVQPKIDAGDVAEDGRSIKLMIAMGAGIPEHYLASGENSNRATAVRDGPSHRQEVQAPAGLSRLHPHPHSRPRHRREAVARSSTSGRRHHCRVHLPRDRHRRYAGHVPGCRQYRPSPGHRQAERLDLRPNGRPPLLRNPGQRGRRRRRGCGFFDISRGNGVAE